MDGCSLDRSRRDYSEGWEIHTYWPCFTSCSSVHVQYGMRLQLTSIVVGHLIVLFHFLFRALKVTLEPLKCRCSMDGMDIDYFQGKAVKVVIIRIVIIRM